jgi:signal transduction histidine kinase
VLVVCNPFKAARVRARPDPLLGSFAVSLSNVLARKNAERAGLLERQLFQSQARGHCTLAGGIAHDFNNILTAIVGNLELARMDHAAGRPIDESLVAIETAADQATALVQQILAFSRHHQHERAPCHCRPSSLKRCGSCGRRFRR